MPALRVLNIIAQPELQQWQLVGPWQRFTRLELLRIAEGLEMLAEQTTDPSIPSGSDIGSGKGWPVVYFHNIQQ